MAKNLIKTKLLYLESEFSKAVACLRLLSPITHSPRWVSCLHLFNYMKVQIT